MFLKIKELQISVFETGGACSGIPTVTDVDGNIYNTIQIEGQCWMKENIKVTHYPNGDAIPNITSNAEWAALGDSNTDDAYCFYSNNVNSIYGGLYTYAAAIADDWARDNANGQGICPDGWHLPTNDEWLILEGNVDTQFTYEDFQEYNNFTGWRGTDVGIHLKNSETWNGDNSSGFSALPGGVRDRENGGFYKETWGGEFWTATNKFEGHSYYRGMDSSYDNTAIAVKYNSSGFSVRCLKDQGHQFLMYMLIYLQL